MTRLHHIVRVLGPDGIALVPNPVIGVKTVIAPELTEQIGDVKSLKLQIPIVSFKSKPVNAVVATLPKFIGQLVVGRDVARALTSYPRARIKKGARA